MIKLDRLKVELKILRYLIPNIYFNFHYLPLYQAWKLPIVFYKPHFGMLKGKVLIQPVGGKISHAMIKVGFDKVALYPNIGIRFQNAGGSIFFRGYCNIGNSSAIAVGEKGVLEFGENFCATSQLKIACQHKITFEKNVLCGWESFFVDSDFHRLSNIHGVSTPIPYAPIYIGEGCWFSFKTVVMKGVNLAPFCVVSSNSLVNKSFDEPYSMLAGTPARLVKSGFYRKKGDDAIHYPEIGL